MSFKEKIYKSLSDYRERELKIYGKGKWRGNSYGHILPEDKKEKNILPKYRRSFFESKEEKMKLHPCFHHLNSSQAMCINFFYPLIQEEHLNLITDYMGFNDEVINYESVEFEKESKLDGVNKRRPTNFDFYFETKSGKKFFFEIKYTEHGFGKAVNDSEHREKFEQVYSHHLAKAIQSKYTEMKEFFENYQIIRNLIHIGENSYVVFLYPEGNLSVSKSALFAKENIVKQDYTTHLLNITWEDLVSHMANNSNANLDYLSGFQKKYLAF
jgi:hypothetical protein